MRRRTPVPLNSPRQALTADEWAGRGLLLIAYVTYILSSALVLQDIVPIEAKHGVFIFIAAVSLLRQPRHSLLAVAVALPIALVYVLGGLLPYAAMVLVFATGLPMIWEGVLSVVARRDYRFLLLLALIPMIPALLSLPTLQNDGLLDTTYGRPRMLLGYFHPKEAAVSFAFPMLLTMLVTGSARAIPWFLGATFLWIIGSRNVSLMIFLAWVLRWHGRWALVGLLTSIAVLALWLVSSNDWYDMIDILLSLRLSVWTDVLSTAHTLDGLDMQSGERFGTDNFFVEALATAGSGAFPLVFLWMVTVGLVLRPRSQSSSWPRVSFAMLIFYASFDSGLASTGNMMHVLLWSIMLSPLFQRRPARRPVLTPTKSTDRVPVGIASA